MSWFINICKQKKPYLFLLLAGVLLLPLYHTYVFSGQLLQLRHLGSLLQENREILQGAASVQDEVKRLETILEANKAEVLSIGAFMPPYQDLPGLIVGFWNLIEEHELKSKQLFMGDEVEKPRYSYYTVHFSVLGKTENVYAFLEDLERYPRKLGFAELLLVALEEDTLQAELQLEVYMLGQKEEEHK